ncbi:transcription factor Spt20, partial [Piptocephalis cylindrospora]
LKKHEASRPSLILHFYHQHFKFDRLDTMYMYTGPMRHFLECLYSREIPPELTDIFEDFKCSYYEGRLIVELHDHRPRKKNQGERRSSSTSSDQDVRINRILLHPTADSVRADLCRLNEQHGGNWGIDVLHELEGRIMLATEDPLCLDPSVHVSRVANALER